MVLFARAASTNCAAFTDIVSQRLFHIRVLARQAGHVGGNRVPVVGRGDMNRVDVVAIKSYPKISIDIA